MPWNRLVVAINSLFCSVDRGGGGHAPQGCPYFLPGKKQASPERIEPLERISCLRSYDSATDIDT
jgi:hypothetical protein